MKKLIILALALGGLLLPTRGEAPRKPNIVLIMSDDHGYDDVGIRHETGGPSTPHLDRLASQSVEFTQFYAQPLCAPSRASLLTGREFLRTGVWGVHCGRTELNLDEVTLADTLKASGYKTGMFGKWHLASQYYAEDSPRAPWNRGFDDAFFLASLYDDEEPYGVLNGKFLGLEKAGERNSSEWICDLSIDFMKRHRNDPFFLYVPFSAIHAPWNARDQYVQPYLDRGISRPLATLWGYISMLDEYAGRVIDAVDELGLRENTIVIFLSDNGAIPQTYGRIVKKMGRNRLNKEENRLRNPSGLREKKSTVFEGGTRVPAFFRFPKKWSPRTVDTPASICDIYPTLLDAADAKTLPTQRPLDGISLLPALAESGELPARDIFRSVPVQPWPWMKPQNFPWKMKNPEVKWECSDIKGSIAYENQALSLRRGDFKLVKRGPKVMLFNMADDAREKNDIAAQEPERVKSMGKAMRKTWHEIHDDPGSFPARYPLVGFDQTVNLYVNGSLDVLGNTRGEGDHVRVNFNEKGDGVILGLDVQSPGVYRATLTAGTNADGSTSPIRITAGSSELELTLSRTRKIDHTQNQRVYLKHYDEFELGELTFPRSGKQTLRLEITGPSTLIKSLHAIRLTRGEKTK
ncbi:sulfatase-like hydrolase/transferase [Pontiella sulfatireligans]|nr:sulfatase-like hydrolase/transferase [Pontiella sulfatireligans]